MLIADVMVPGRGRTNVWVRDGRIAGFPAACPPGEAVLAGRGRTLIPGLADAHLHLLAAAAAASSIDARTLDDGALSQAIEARALEGPVRVTGYGGSEGALLDRQALDRLCPDRPLRLQYRTGSLWVLNTAALDALASAQTRDPAFERGRDGQLTGRVWRGDALLRSGTPDAQAVQRLGQQWARWGVTSLTDASATTDDTQAAVLEPLLAQLPQRVQLMGSEALAPPRSARWSRGPLKILLDEAALPPLESLCGRIAAAHAQRRSVAIHCVTPAELALALAALITAGAPAKPQGDRIEHGSLISADMIPVMSELGLTVVTQPGFVQAHGDRYLRDVEPTLHSDLYRVRSLLEGGVRVAFSSDAPYGPVNPWLNLRSAVRRITAAGAALNAHEAVNPALALSLHAVTACAPGRGRTLEVGAPADLCLLRADVSWIDSDDPVARTWIGGVPAYVREGVECDCDGVIMDGVPNFAHPGVHQP